jgi:hypothetical protein
MGDRRYRGRNFGDRDRRRGRPAATQLTVLGTSEVLFAGVDFSNKHGLWATNGSPGGTSEILSTNAPGGGLNPTDLIAVNTDSWKTGKSGIFGAGSNWTASSAPTSSQEAVIAVAGTYTVSAISGATVAALRHRQQDRNASGHQRGHVRGDKRYRPGRQSRHRRCAERRDFCAGGNFP